ncbi:MAG: hypothetical protein Q9195_006215 [Heterodermia aff. obscurata]
MILLLPSISTFLIFINNIPLTVLASPASNLSFSPAIHTSIVLVDPAIIWVIRDQNIADFRIPSKATRLLVDPPDPFTIPDWSPGYTAILSAFSLPALHYYSFLHFTERASAYAQSLRAGLHLQRSAPIPGGHFVYRSAVLSRRTLLLGFQLQEIDSRFTLRFIETEGVLESLKVYLNYWKSGAPMGADIVVWKDVGRGRAEQIAVERIWGMIRAVGEE